jgi:hypothetical protein
MSENTRVIATNSVTQNLIIPKNPNVSEIPVWGKKELPTRSTSV